MAKHRTPIPTGPDCRLCPRWEGSGVVCMPGYGPHDPELVLIAESPAKTEDRWCRHCFRLQTAQCRTAHHPAGVPLCLSSSTKVLTADIRWKNLGDVQVGEQIITVSEMPGASHLGISGMTYRSFQIAQVLNVIRRRARCVRVTTDAGCLTGTPDHLIVSRWAGHKRTGRIGGWARLDSLMPFVRTRSSQVLFITPPTSQSSTYESGWLAGFLEGEGCVLGSHSPVSSRKMKRRRGMIGFSQAYNKAQEDALKYVEHLGFVLTNKSVQRRPPYKPMYRAYIRGGMRESLRFLAMTQPRRIIEDFVRVLESDPPFLGRPTYSRVLRVEDVGIQNVVDIITTAGTFLANGFLVHNCGPSGQLIRQVLREVGIDPARVYYSNVAKCSAGGGPGSNPTMLQVRKCTGAYLLDELATLDYSRCRGVMLLGETALRGVLNNGRLTLKECRLRVLDASGPRVPALSGTKEGLEGGQTLPKPPPVSSCSTPRIDSEGVGKGKIARTALSSIPESPQLCQPGTDGRGTLIIKSSLRCTFHPASALPGRNPGLYEEIVGDFRDLLEPARTPLNDAVSCRTPAELDQVFGVPEVVGIDLEWNPENPAEITAIAVSDGAINAHVESVACLVAWVAQAQLRSVRE